VTEKAEIAPFALIVEDDPQIRRFLRTALASEGVEVSEVGVGERALVEAAMRKPDLLILDLGLPDMDGVEVVRRLRNAGGRVPVLFLTARDAKDDAITGLTVGGDDYVTKPFSLGEVVARRRFVAPETAWDGKDFSQLASRLSAALTALSDDVVGVLPAKL
jgi:DNA-binding response OmpR family regulator